MTKERTALLIRCSRAEADKIREMALRERRTVSGYVLHAVISRIAFREHIKQPLGLSPKQSRLPKARRRQE